MPNVSLLCALPAPEVSEKPMNELLLMGVVFFLIGLAALGGAVASLVGANRRRAQWQPADGTVVKLVFTTRTMQAPVVAFSSPGAVPI